ncbi:NAD(P)H-hydrate dehydratase [Acidithiobacillus sp.]
MMPTPMIPLDWDSLRGPPPRPRAAHKGDFGHVFVLGGGPGMGGALALSCSAAYRAGAGLVTAIGHPAAAIYLAAQLPEATWRDWPASFADWLPATAVLAVGPGLGQGLAPHNLLQEIGSMSQPQVWDADALNILARMGPTLLRSDALRIFTPHPGEAGRLLGISAAAVQADREGVVGQLLARYGGVWVLKGQGTLLGDATRRRRCDLGNPGMATGGSGDVLTGLLAGLLAIGMAPWEAAQVGVCLHARAGDLAAARLGEESLLAGDILHALPDVLQELPRHG